MTLPLFSRHVDRKQKETEDSASPSAEDAALLCSISSTSSTPPAGNMSVKKPEAKADAKAEAKTEANEPAAAAAAAATPSRPEPAVAAGIPVSRLPQQQYVDHTYSDYKDVDEDDLRLMTASGVGSKVPGSGDKEPAGKMAFTMIKTRGSGGSILMPFPGKLMEVLDRGDLTSIVDWMPHGRAFIVKQPKVFTTQVLPRFFKQTKFLSFTRQLNLWGFKRITRGLDAGAYYHELFLPGRPNLAMRMRRQKIKGTGIRPMPNPGAEPNFYYDHPHVAKVPRSGAPIPLPPLPSERIADLMGGQGQVPDQTAFVGQAPMQQQPEQAQTVLSQGHHQAFRRGMAQPPSQQLSGLANLGGNQGAFPARTMGRGLGIGMSLNVDDLSSVAPSQNAMSAAAAAEHRLRGYMAPGLTSSSSSTSKMMARHSLPSRISSAHPEAHDPASHPTSERASRYLRQASMSNAAPRSFAPANSDAHDEVASANRRLMQRLLEQTTSAPAPPDMLGHHGLLAGRRPSYQTSEAASLLGRGGSVMTPQPAALAGMESFMPQQQSSPMYPFPTDYGSYNSDPRGNNSVGSYSASMPPASSGSSTHSADIATVTNALREAQRLEELARSQRAAARALAGALQKRMGGQDLTLPLGQDFQHR